MWKAVFKKLYLIISSILFPNVLKFFYAGTKCFLIYVTSALLTHSFPVQNTPWKHQKTVRCIFMPSVDGLITQHSLSSLYLPTRLSYCISTVPVKINPLQLFSTKSWDFFNCYFAEYLWTVPSNFRSGFIWFSELRLSCLRNRQLCITITINKKGVLLRWNKLSSNKTQGKQFSLFLVLVTITLVTMLPAI